MRQLLSLLLFATLFWVCRHEPTSSGSGPLDCDSSLQFVEIKDTCLELPPAGLAICDSAIKIFHLLPEFNPSNQYDILYYKAYEKDINGFIDKLSSLHRIHLCSGENFALLEDNTALTGTRPKWNPNGWILLPHSRLYKILYNGDSLKQLTITGGRFYPSWLGADTIICTIPTTGTVLYDKNGAILDTLFSIGIVSGGLKENKFANASLIDGKVYVGYYTLPGWDFTPLSDTESASGCDWLDKNHIIWNNEQGIFKVNINTGEKTTIKATCENVYIQDFAVNPENPDRLLLSRSEKKVYGTDSIFCTSGISIFDIPTGREWLIVLPE